MTPTGAWCPVCRVGPFRTYQKTDGGFFFFCEPCKVEVTVDKHPFMPVEKLMEVGMQD